MIKKDKTYCEISLEEHRKHKWKIEIRSKVPLISKFDLSVYYTPWVSEPCKAIAHDPNKAYEFTWKSNSVAVVSDGSAVLGLGNIWGLAWLPVMEWKAILLKEFWWVDGVPIVLDTQDPEEIINIVKNIAPGFWGINLEDIKAPECFYIEEQLKEQLDIPVFHDDQHGTAIVVLAGLINSLRLTNKKAEDIKVVVSGAGAAGIAIANLLVHFGVKNVIVVDSKGAIYPGRENLNPYKVKVAKFNINNEKWTLQDVLRGADVFVGVSQPNLLWSEDIRQMADKPIVFALANPIPEILPDEAKKWGAFIIATWRSDFPNQINNLLAFPGVFRGALDARLKSIETKHKIAAAKAIADYVDDLSPEKIVPDPLDKNVAKVVAEAIKKA